MIFDRFKKKYPNSKYIAQLIEPVNAFVKKQQRNGALTNKMVFVAGNGVKLNTLNQVLALTKGKTVFVNLWCNQCGQSMEDIGKESQRLSTWFKDKPVVFLFIYNDDEENVKRWKKLIAYNHLEGTHILANRALYEDILAKIKIINIPTYFIIKKDGSYKQTRSQNPLDILSVADELDAALKQ